MIRYEVSVDGSASIFGQIHGEDIEDVETAIVNAVLLDLNHVGGAGPSHDYSPEHIEVLDWEVDPEDQHD